MPDRLEGMEVFARVASTGSFSGAARALSMSPAMVTKHIDATEKRLGVKLLFRTTRRLTLTEAGRVYLDLCQRVLPEIGEAEAGLAAQRYAIGGTLRLNAPVSFGSKHLTPLLAPFLARHPALKVELGLNDRAVDLIDEGWDMAVRIGDMTDFRLTARKLSACSMLVCAAPVYLARRGTPKEVADLSGHDCLGYTLARSARPDEWRFGRKGEIAVKVKGVLWGNNGDSLLEAAKTGLGVIYQPGFLVAEALADGSLVALELDHPPHDLAGIFAVHPHDRRPPAKVRAMIDYLVECFAAGAPWDRPRKNNGLTSPSGNP